MHFSPRASWLTVSALLLAAGALIAWRIWPHPVASVPILIAGNTMGGTWSVKIVHLPPSISSQSLQAEVGTRLDRLDRQMSIWKPESDLSRFNQYRGTDWFAVPREVAEVITVAQRISEQSGGAFDVTVGPLVLLWGFGPQRSGGQIGQIPSDEAIAAARRHVDYRLLDCRLSPPALRKRDPKLYVDLGGIAKGYAADSVAAYLQSIGLNDFLVAVGGELRAHGSSRDGRPWRVGIETPTPDVRRIYRQLDLQNASLSTSGDYRNFIEFAGKRYCHEIDPRTGRPIDTALASVSILHPSGTEADGFATALMVLGPHEGYDLARRLKISAFFIIRQSDHFEILETPAGSFADQSAPPQ